MKVLKSLLFRFVVVVLFFVALLAASDNSEEVSLTFLEYVTPTWPISWWVLSAFVCGVIFASVFNTWTNTRLRLVARKANKVVDKTNHDIDLVKAEKSG
ncbi:MAG: putative integral membrane protein [Candidatus Azotimanducaceae bacterium]|jgi:uncharacterized integral membrane protein